MSIKCARRALKSNFYKYVMVSVVLVGLTCANGRAELFQNDSYSNPKTVIKYAMFGGAGEVALT